MIFLPADACDPGSFLNATTNECVSCRPGYYCSAGIITRCPDNMASPANSTEVSGCYCPSGYTLDSSGFNCEECYENFFCDGTKATACTALSRSPSKSTSTQNCTCAPGAFLNGTTCVLCEAGFHCLGGMHPATACPEHSYSLAGASVPEKCQCIAPFVMISRQEFACVHIEDASAQFDLMQVQLPEVSIYGLKNALAIDVQELSEAQKQALILHGEATCINEYGAGSLCQSDITGAVIDTEHSMLIFKNVIVDPRFVTLLFNVFRQAKLTKEVYIQRREIWYTDWYGRSGRKSSMIEVQGKVSFSSMQKLKQYYEDLPVLVSAVRAAVYRFKQADDNLHTVQVLVQPNVLRLSWDWLHADALQCLSKDGEHVATSGFRKTISSQYNLYDVGALPCPTVEQIACMQAKTGLGTSFFNNKTAAQCDLDIKILFEGQHSPALSAHTLQTLRDVFDVEEDSLRETNVSLVKYWKNSNTFDEMSTQTQEIEAAAQREQTAREFEVVLFDSGIQSSTFWTVTFTTDSAAVLQSDWSWLLLATGFTAVDADWGVDASAQVQMHAINTLAIFGHTAVSEAVTGPLALSMRTVPNKTKELILGVHEYTLGELELRNTTAKICAFSGCAACDLENATSWLQTSEKFTWEKLSGDNVSFLIAAIPDTTNLTCQSTRSRAVMVNATTTIDTCDTARFFQSAQVFVPFPPEIVTHFVLDIVVGSVSGNLTASDVFVEASAEGSLVHAGIFVPTLEACTETKLVEESMLRALFSAIWPYVAIPDTQQLVQHACRFECTNTSQNVDIHSIHNDSNAAYHCDFTATTISQVKPTQDEAVQDLNGRPNSFLLPPTEYHLLHQSSFLTFSSLCSLENIVEYFDHIYTAEYTELPFNAEAPYAMRLATTSTWNAFEKQECLATSDHAQRSRACGYAVNVSISTSTGKTCATITSLNVLLSEFRVRKYISQYSAVLLERGIDTLNYSSSISSGDMYLSVDSMQSIGALVHSLHDTDNVVFEQEPMNLIQHTLRVKFESPVTKTEELFLLEKVHLQIPYEKQTNFFSKKLAEFYMYTVSAVDQDASSDDAFENELDILSSLLQESHVDIFTIKNMTHSTLVFSDAMTMMTAGEKILVDHSTREKAIKISIESDKTCAEINETVRSIQYIPMPILNKRLHVVGSSLSCSTLLQLTYPSPSCASKEVLHVQRSIVQEESCAKVADYARVKVSALHPGSFMRGMDVLSSFVPRRLSHFQHTANVCETRVDMIEMLQNAVSSFGKFCLLFAQGALQRTPVLFLG